MPLRKVRSQRQAEPEPQATPFGSGSAPAEKRTVNVQQNRTDQLATNRTACELGGPKAHQKQSYRRQWSQ